MEELHLGHLEVLYILALTKEVTFYFLKLPERTLSSSSVSFNATYLAKQNKGGQIINSTFFKTIILQ